MNHLWNGVKSRSPQSGLGDWSWQTDIINWLIMTDGHHQLADHDRLTSSIGWSWKTDIINWLIMTDGHHQLADHDRLTSSIGWSWQTDIINWLIMTDGHHQLADHDRRTSSIGWSWQTDIISWLRGYHGWEGHVQSWFWACAQPMRDGVTK